MTIDAVLLDVDGTLIDSNDAHARAWSDAFTERGISASYESIRTRIGMGGDHLLPDLIGVEKSEALGRELSKRRGEIFRAKYLGELRAFAGTREWLTRLNEDGLRLVVATSASADDLHALLKQAGLDDLLDRFTTSDDAERSKPDPDIVVSALKKSGAAPERAIMVGDTPYDLAAAARAGVAGVGFTCGGWAAADLHPALAIFDGPRHALREHARSPFARR